jgi:ABC-type multidrug transport system permease subunit
MWLPLMVWRRNLLPRSLFWTALYLAAAFYLTNLCFSWNHESRNFVPALIFLLVCTMVIVNRLIEARPPDTSVAEP